MSKDEDSVRILTEVLFEAWSDAEPKHDVTLYPTSYMETFADMARAVMEFLEIDEVPIEN